MTTLKSKFAQASLGLIAGASLLLVAGSAMAATFERNLTVGSRGADVTALQTAVGINPTTGYFGQLTKAAVKAYQTAHSISPVSGYVGPLTRSVLNAGGTTVPTGCTTAFDPMTGKPCTGTTTTTTGPVSVALSSDSPANTTILSSQALADLAHFTFTGNGTLKTIVLQRTGLSASGDLSNLYLFDGNTRLTDGASVNTNGVITFTNINAAISGSKVISVKADMASSISSVTLGVTMTSFTADASTNAVNVAGNILSVAAAPSNITSATLGANTVSTASINAGAMQYTVWSSPLTISGRTAWLKGLNLRVIGSAPTDAVQNLKLYVDGTQAGSAVMVNANGYAFFDFGTTPVSLTTGSHTIDVRGDVQKGSNRTVQFSIQNAADLMIADSQLGINVAATSAVANGAAGTITINAGSVTTTITPSFQTLTNVTGGATNTVIGSFRLHAYGEDVKITTLTVKPNVTSGTVASGSSTNLSNVTVYLNGGQVGSSTAYDGTNAIAFSLGSSMVLPAGVDSIVEIRADLQNSTSVNYTAGVVTTQLTVGSSNAQGMSSLSTSINVPSATIVTSGLTIATGSLTVTKSTAYANQTLNPNMTGAKLASFVLQNVSTSESVRVTNLAVSLALTSVGSTNYSNLVTDETSGSGATPINPSTAAAGATSSNNFSVNFTIAPGATKIINIMSDLGTATGSVVVSLTPTALGSSSNVNVTPSAATGQTITISTGTFSATPTLVTSSSTIAQFIAAAGGATDGSKATFNVVASNGVATINELKFVVRGSSAVNGLGTVASVRVGSMSAPITLATTNYASISATMSSGATVATVSSSTGIAFGSVLLIDSEQMLVGATVSSDLTWTVTRAYNGTTAAAHDSGAVVYVKNGVAALSGLAITVPNSTAGVNIDAYPTYSPVGTGGSTSSSVAKISLSYAKYTIGGTTQINCVSSSVCTSGTVNAVPEVAAPAMILVGSKPTVTVAQPAATLAVASIAAIDVTVKADAKGDITLVSFPITVGLNGATVSGTATTNIAVYAGSDLSTNLTSVNTAFGAGTGGSSTITLTNSGYRINAGESVTFHVYVTLTAVASGASGSNSMATSLATGSGFSWTDTAGGGSALTGTSSIYGYPSSTTSVIKN